MFMSKTTTDVLRKLRHTTKALSYTTSNSPTYNVRDQLRALLRETAQPVAVVTSLMPPDVNSKNCTFHGATLSSFTSVALDPHPLITFALRIPSRMAASLDAAEAHDENSHMVINLLSAEQASLAIKFSRPDLYPEPFSDTPFILTEEGLPVLSGALGAMSCKLVSKAIPLHDLDYLENGLSRGRETVEEPILRAGCVASELFIARVTRVEAWVGKNVGESELQASPLLYYRRGYISCHPCTPNTC